MSKTPASSKKRARRPSTALPTGGEDIETDLDVYRVQDQVGEGTFSVVFRAVAATCGTVVAAKVLKDGQSDYNRIYNEFRCLLALKGHPNVVDVLDGSFDQATTDADGGRVTVIMRCASTCRRARHAVMPSCSARVTLTLAPVGCAQVL